MSIVLSHMSALQYWLSTRCDISFHQVVPYAKTKISKPPKFEKSDELCLLARPLHALVSKSSFRRPSKTLVCHVWNGPLPKGAVLDSGKGFSVCSPELCFIQIANTLPLPQLVKLGFELCGTYDTSRETSYSVEPLTTLASLSSFISAMQGVKGSIKAAQAAKYILENSASPMETNLALLLCLPYKYGGYGFPKPLLNYRIDIPRSREHPSAVEFYVCDQYWPTARLAVEYDSTLFHTGQTRIAYDSIRRSDLAFLDISVLTATFDQVKDSRKMDQFARTIAKLLGKRLRYSEPNFSHARQNLRNLLFDDAKDPLLAQILGWRKLFDTHV